MFADGRTVPSGEIVETEVCIVGAGPAGLVLAQELGAAGIEIVLVERGAQGSRPAVPDTAINVGIKYDPVSSRSFEVGGSVQRWKVRTPLGQGFGRLRELEPIDFERRDWVPHSGWPFGKEQLRPFYARARGFFECDWPSADPEPGWDESLHAGPFAAGTRTTTRVFSFVNPGVFPGGVWRSITNSERVMALTNAVAVEVRCDASPTTVSSVRVQTASDHEFSVRARTYLLAAGGIENARLLLVSRDRQPNGLGNQHDLVGRYFMEHPHYASGRVVPASRDAFVDESHYEIHSRDGVILQKKYCLPESTVRREGLLGCTFRFEAKPLTDSDHTLRYSEKASSSIDEATSLARAVLGRQRGHQPGEVLRRALAGAPHVVRYAVNRGRVKLLRAAKAGRYVEPQAFWIRAMAEQAPNPASRLRLLPERDRFGVPLVALDWRWTDQDVSSMKRSQELLAQALASNGHRSESLLEGRRLPPALSGGMHHMGTTRMADAPRDGVVDRHGRVHGVDNLFIAGSSVFPTVGYANPTLTIIAMSLRLADHVRALVRGS